MIASFRRYTPEMPARNSYVDFVCEQLAPLGRIRVRAMFGGYGLYCDDLFFALIADNVLYLKVDEVNRPEFEALGLQPFKPFEDKPETMNYFPAPADMFESSEGLHRWAGGALACARRAAAAKGNRGGAKRVRSARKARA